MWCHLIFTYPNLFCDTCHKWAKWPTCQNFFLSFLALSLLSLFFSLFLRAMDDHLSPISDDLSMSIYLIFSQLASCHYMLPSITSSIAQPVKLTQREKRTLSALDTESMAFPAAYTEISLPKLLFQTIPLLRLIGNLISSLLRLLGFSDFLETDPPPPSPESRPPVCPPVSAVLIREFLPLMKYRGSSSDPPESCTVCLCEFEVGEGVRELKNCKHVFHRSCLDRWMNCDQRTCPLCRTQFVPKGMQEEYDRWLWDAAAAGRGVLDLYSED